MLAESAVNTLQVAVFGECLIARCLRRLPGTVHLDCNALAAVRKIGYQIVNKMISFGRMSYNSDIPQIPAIGIQRRRALPKFGDDLIENMLSHSDSTVSFSMNMRGGRNSADRARRAAHQDS